METPIRLRTKLGFWLALGMFSTALAEVLSGSFPLPFASIDGPLLVVPVYTAHIVLGLWAIHRFGRPTFATMFFVGVLFGFYEFYLTRVMFSPPWGESLVIGGVDWVAVAVLGLFWHPVFAWMLPLSLVERHALASNEVTPALPRWLRRGGWAGMTVVIAAAFLHGSLAPDPRTAVLSLVTTATGLIGAVMLWRRSPARRQLRLRDLAPSDGQALVLGLIIAAMYVVMGPLFRPDVVPDSTANIITFLLYGLVLAALAGALSRARATAPGPWASPKPVPRAAVPVYAVVMVGAAMLGWANQAALGLWATAVVLGLTMTVQAVRGLRDPGRDDQRVGGAALAEGSTAERADAPD